MAKRGTSVVEARLLAAHGAGLGEYLRDLYVVRGLTMRELRVPLGTVSHVRIRALLIKYGVQIRRGSEAVAHQWVRLPERRKTQAESMRRASTARAANGEHWAKGHTKETHPGLARYAEKLAARQWLTAPNVVARARESTMARHREDPSTHSQSTAAPSRIERLMMTWLEARGIRYVFQHPIVAGADLLFLDFFLPDIGIGIEVTNSRSRVPPERLRTLLQAGIPTIAVYNYAVEKTGLPNADEAIARAKRGEFNPTTVGECWVGTGRRYNSTRMKAEADEPLR